MDATGKFGLRKKAPYITYYAIRPCVAAALHGKPQLKHIQTHTHTKKKKKKVGKSKYHHSVYSILVLYLINQITSKILPACYICYNPHKLVLASSIFRGPLNLSITVRSKLVAEGPLLVSIRDNLE